MYGTSCAKQRSFFFLRCFIPCLSTLLYRIKKLSWAHSTIGNVVRESNVLVTFLERCFARCICYFWAIFVFCCVWEPMEPIDQRELERTAQQLSFELAELERDAAANRTPRFWHKWTDAWAQRRHERINKRRGVTPLIGRRWVPWVCFAGVGLIWLPDQQKVRALLAFDELHERVKMRIHCWYWQRTMDPEQFALLMEQIEKSVPRSKCVESTKCPL